MILPPIVGEVTQPVNTVILAVMLWKQLDISKRVERLEDILLGGSREKVTPFDRHHGVIFTK